MLLGRPVSGLAKLEATPCRCRAAGPGDVWVCQRLALWEGAGRARLTWAHLEGSK